VCSSDLDWDLDLSFGKAGEVQVNELLTASIETVEVKRDRRWKETKNLYIEMACFSEKINSWYLSGLSTTKASHWAFVLEDIVLIVPTLKLKDVVEAKGRKIEMIRPEYSTRGYLINWTDVGI
jgi:hypothetical protein